MLRYLIYRKVQGPAADSDGGDEKRLLCFYNLIELAQNIIFGKKCLQLKKFKFNLMQPLTTP